MSLTKEQLLSSRPRTSEVTLPEGEVIKLRVMTIRETFDFYERNNKLTDADPYGTHELLLAKCLANPDGTRMFADDDAASLSDAFSIAGFNLLFDAAMELNGLRTRSAEKQELAQAAKKSKATRT